MVFPGFFADPVQIPVDLFVLIPYDPDQHLNTFLVQDRRFFSARHQQIKREQKPFLFPHVL